jgi:EpsI family protein
VPVSVAELKALGPGDFLTRDYYNVLQRRDLSLFIAFFPSQRQGDTIHSPKNCLPGAGWIPIESNRIWINGQQGQKVEANRYLVGKGNDRAMVLYWYQAHGHATASEYMAKYHLVADAITMNRSDGALIRVTTFLGNGGESVHEAETRAIGFAQVVLSVLDNYVPR